VLLSTATKTLQDQLHGRDLPRLIEALRLPVSTALLKGRSSYLCIHRMQQALQGNPGLGPKAARLLPRLERWAQATSSGDLAEVEDLDERSPLLPLVTSTRENCLGSACPSFKDCHVHHARREALDADVVVINHHLFFADMAIRESGMAELLPSVRTVIFDEAHQLNETGTQFLGTELATGALLDFVRDLLAAGLQLARGLVDWQTVAAELEYATRELRLVLGKRSAGARLAWSGPVPEGLAPEPWQAALARLRQALEAVTESLDTVSELAPDFLRLLARARTFRDRLELFAAQGCKDRVRWVEVGQQARLVESPLDIAQSMRDHWFGADQAHRTWIFTSATLGDDEALSWFTGACGLEAASVLRVGSPFDFPRQAALYIPPDLPLPEDPGHAGEVARLAGDGALRLGGRTLVLTTSLRALRQIGESLQERFADAALDVLVQGQWTRRELIERFRRGGQDGRGCLLVGSASFWEGIDVPGDALQLVVIDKLPFPPPQDPLVQARSQALQAQGRSPFKDYFLPEAAVALKQGAGRLIRSESDQGALVVCDTRLQSKSYGSRLLKALPPMTRLKTQEEWLTWLDGLTRSDTTGAC
jgi:ATP-dependent DNA helicase DinG